MKFLITDVEFDWDNEDGALLTIHEKEDIVSETVGQIWEADDEDDLVEELTAAYGWCICSLNFRHVLS